jgi:hypothetical protein
MSHVAADQYARLDGIGKTSYVQPLVAPLALAEGSSD